MDKGQGDRDRKKPKSAETTRSESKHSIAGSEDDGGDWSGFEPTDGNVRERVLQKRVGILEEVVRQLKDKIEKMEGIQEELRKDNVALRRECGDLKSVLQAHEIKVGNNEENVKQLDARQKVWRKEQEEEKVNFKKVMENQIKEENISKAVVRVIKEKQGLVRDTVEKKKCVVVFGIKDEKMPVRYDREKFEKKIAVDIVKEVEDEGKKLEEEIEEVVRIGKYNEGGQRPMKIRFKSQSTAEEILGRSWRLANKDAYKNIWIKKDMTEEERAKTKELIDEAKEKNANRTEEEKNVFFWRVLDMRIRKWYLRREGNGERN